MYRERWIKFNFLTHGGKGKKKNSSQIQQVNVSYIQSCGYVWLNYIQSGNLIQVLRWVMD